MSIPKAEMVGFVKSLGIDPNEASVVTIDNERTGYTSVSRTTDESATLDFLESHGINPDAVAVVELTRNEVIVTRIKYDRYGMAVYTLGTKGVELQFESEAYPIV